MQVGLLAPQGWKGEYDGWSPADAWARTIELARQAEGSGSRRCGSSITSTRCRRRPRRSRSSRSRSCPRWRWRPSASGSATWSSAPGSEPGPHREDGVDDRRHQRRPVRARHRRRLEGRGVAGLRLRLSDDRRTDARAGRQPRGDPRHARARPGDLRRRVRPVRGAINVPKGIQEPRIPIIVGGNGARVTAG